MRHRLADVLVIGLQGAGEGVTRLSVSREPEGLDRIQASGDAARPQLLQPVVHEPEPLGDLAKSMPGRSLDRPQQLDEAFLEPAHDVDAVDRARTSYLVQGYGSPTHA